MKKLYFLIIIASHYSQINYIKLFLCKHESVHCQQNSQQKQHFLPLWPESLCFTVLFTNFHERLRKLTETTNRGKSL